jgi:HK97 family phage major capsid protein
MTLKNKKTDQPTPTNSIEQLHTRLGQIAEECKVIQNIADNEQRALTDEEVANLENFKREFDTVEKEIRTRAAANEMNDRMVALARPGQRLSQPEDLPGGEPSNQPDERPRITGGLPVGSSKSTFGFRSMGEFALAARRTKFGKPDMRIVNAPTTFGSEGVNEDGGFAVPPDFRQNIMKQILGEESLMSMCDQQTTTSNSLSLPLDTTTPWQTSGGVIPQWLGEGANLTATKPRLGALETKLNKLAALVPITEELMQDAGALTSWLSTKVPEKFNSFINDVIITGDGVGKPQGMLNSAAKVTVAAVSGQGAGTVVARNIVDMFARSYGPLRRNGVWLINQDVEPLLQVLVMPGTSPNFPAYLPPGGLSAAPYATLLGRPVIPIEACPALGTEGDIMFVIPNQYLVVLKGGMRTDVSMHLYFDSDHTAFRFVMRIGGQSYWPAPAARRNGSNTLSPIVTLNGTRT